MFQDIVNQPIFLSFVGHHKLVTIGVSLDLFQTAASMFPSDLVQTLFDPDDFLRVDFQIDGGPLHAGQRLMNHDPAVGQRVAFTGSTGSQ